ncbi:helix-turn-helix domain-containing protein [Streptomyces sp. M10(2022)]
MPRIAEARAGAEPSSPKQHARRRGILRAAADIAAETGLERVQMHEVAKSAGVAIGTLYRYFRRRPTSSPPSWPSRSRIRRAAARAGGGKLAAGSRVRDAGQCHP